MTDRLCQRVSAMEDQQADILQRLDAVEDKARSWQKFTWVVNKLLTVAGMLLAYLQLKGDGK